jgi:hypothetical protein
LLSIVGYHLQIGKFWITKKKKTVDFDYNINGQILETVASNPYLGAELTNTMSWDKQVQKVVAKGNKALGVFVSSAPRYGFDATVSKICPLML